MTTPQQHADIVQDGRERDDTLRAILNILDDFGDERERTNDTQRAVLNILEDFGDEKERLHDTQKAVLNILDDFDEKNEELRAEIAERSRAEAALESQTDALAQSNAELEMFAYAASHDLSEPLRAIAGPASLIARRYRGALDDDADELIGFITDGCERMGALIADLLAYSRVGRIEEQWQPVSCNALTRRVLSALAPAIEEAGASVSVADLPTVTAEATQLAQVFQNLVSNAIKFRRLDVAPAVTIDAARSDLGWIFRVSDNGIGIHARHRDRVFGMFKRLHARDEYPGTGIGLALVKKIIDRHGGTIVITDGPNGIGTTFAFTIPDTRGVTT